MNKALALLLSSSCFLITACDTSINKQVEQKLQKTQKDILSPTGKPFNFDEKNSVKSGDPSHGVNLPPIEGETTVDLSQAVLIPAEQFHKPKQTKLKNQVVEWQEANLQKYDSEDGNTISID